MDVTLRIAGRYLKTRRSTGFITLLSWISIVGVTIGVAALIIVPAVMNGFEGEVRDRIAGTNAHVLLLSYEQRGLVDTTKVLPLLRRRPGVLGVSPFVYSKALVTREGVADGIIVKGVDLRQEREVTTVARDITPPLEQIPDSTQDGMPGIVLGAEIASRLRAGVGERVVLATLHGGIDSPIGLVPRLQPFHVVGIFSSGLYEYDSSLAYISLAEAKRLFEVEGMTGIQIRIRNLFDAPAFAGALTEDLGGYPYRTSDWIEQNANLFRFMKIEKFTMFVILALIVIVAALNIVSTLILLAMEKRHDVGALLAMGASQADIVRVFLYAGLGIGLVGVVLGTGLGLIGCWALGKYRFIEIPSDVYFLSTLPVEVEAPDVLLVIVVTLALCLLAAAYPAWFASRRSPVESLRKA
ncbi:MAG: ABC transporter permease [Candidatus Eiseniibacteriota bacterium]